MGGTVEACKFHLGLAFQVVTTCSLFDEDLQASSQFLKSSPVPILLFQSPGKPHWRVWCQDDLGGYQDKCSLVHCGNVSKTSSWWIW